MTKLGQVSEVRAHYPTLFCPLSYNNKQRRKKGEETSTTDVFIYNTIVITRRKNRKGYVDG